jgi:hypothetical protein
MQVQKALSGPERKAPEIQGVSACFCGAAWQRKIPGQVQFDADSHPIERFLSVALQAKRLLA